MKCQAQESARAPLTSTARRLMYRLVALLAACATFSACASLVPRSHVVAAEAKWSASGIQNYSFTLGVGSLSPSTECSPDSTIEVEVQGGETVRFGTCSAKSEMAQHFGSIPRIFATIHANRLERPPRYLVHFDDILGYPLTIDANYSRWMTDHAVQYYIRDFRRLD